MPPELVGDTEAVSGFTTGGRYGSRTVYELTSTQGSYWHGPCRRPGCQGGQLTELVSVHLQPAGFEVVRDGGGYVALVGPGIDDHDTDPLYAAVSGRPGTRGPSS